MSKASFLWVFLLPGMFYVPIFFINIKNFPRLEISYASLNVVLYIFILIFLAAKNLRSARILHLSAWLVPYIVSSMSYLLALALTNNTIHAARISLVDILIVASFMPYLAVQAWIYSALISIFLLLLGLRK